MKQSVVVFLYSVFLPTLTIAQSEGDVRLAGADFKYRGRLEIYWQGKWGTFCSISPGGAEAACKQMGFSSVFTYASYNHIDGLSFNVSKASKDTPIAIGDTYCSVFYTPHHILRCPFTSDVPQSCSHDYDVILYCVPSSQWLHPYETEVRLNSSTYLSTGTLEIYINKEWGNVCGDKFDQGAADSVCRQMGYTGATTFSSSSKATTQTTWLNGVSCSSQSCSCLNGCFGRAPTTPTSCGNSNYVNVTCTFDVKVANSSTAGNYNECTNYQSSCGHGSGSLSMAIIIVIVVMVLIVAIVCCILTAAGIAYAVHRNRRNKNKGYCSVNTE